MKRALHYLHDTIEIPRIIRVNGMDMLLTYIDVSYAIHSDVKRHTGDLMALGKGVIQGKPSNKN